MYLQFIGTLLLLFKELDDFGFNVKFGHKCFSLLKNNYAIDFGNLIDGLYKLRLDNVLMNPCLFIALLELSVVC